MARAAKCYDVNGKEKMYNVGAVEEDSISNDRMK